MVVKPIFGFFMLYPLLRRHWRAVAVVAGALAALTAFTAALFGAEVFVRYLTGNPILATPPAPQPPDVLYRGGENQSLIAALSRLGHLDTSRGWPLLHPAFVVTAAIITGVTAWLTARLPDDRSALAAAAAVPAALLLYPASLEHYTLLLLPTMLYVWTRRAELGLSMPLVVAVISVQFALIRYDRGSMAMMASLLQWVLLTYVSLRMLSPRAARSRLRPGALTR
jgi:hypothetical protein